MRCPLSALKSICRISCNCRNSKASCRRLRVQFGILAIIAFQCVHCIFQGKLLAQGKTYSTAIYISICILGICPAWPVCSLPSVWEVQGQLNALMDGLLLFCFIRDFVSSIFCPVETFFASQPKSRQHNLTTILPLVKGSIGIDSTTELSKYIYTYSCSAWPNEPILFYLPHIV